MNQIPNIPHPGLPPKDGQGRALYAPPLGGNKKGGSSIDKISKFKFQIMKVIEIKDLHKIYSSSDIEVHAVNGVTLDFQEAEFAAIVGPSGSGKTTLLNLLGGLDHADIGADPDRRNRSFKT